MYEPKPIDTSDVILPKELLFLPPSHKRILKMV